MAKYNEALGYIIHTRPFKNTSLIIELFSLEFGKIQLIGKGIKKNKNYKSQIQYFNRVKVQFFGKSNLKTLSSINVIPTRELSSLVSKMAAMYLNELIHLSVNEGEKALSLFEAYEASLDSFGKMKLSILLRRFELRLLKYNGFELSVSQYDIDSWLAIDENQGLTITTKNSEKLCKVSDFNEFINGHDLTKIQLTNVNKLMASAINLNVSYKNIHSRNMLKSLIKK